MEGTKVLRCVDLLFDGEPGRLRNIKDCLDFFRLLCDNKLIKFTFLPYIRLQRLLSFVAFLLHFVTFQSLKGSVRA